MLSILFCLLNMNETTVFFKKIIIILEYNVIFGSEDDCSAIEMSRNVLPNNKNLIN
jgi:hypothetical protein